VDLIRAKQAPKVRGTGPEKTAEQDTSIKVPSFIPHPARAGARTAPLSVRRPALAALLCEEETARRLLAKAGRRLRMDAAFPCILPGHDERKPSASVWRSPSGELVYRDFHERHGRGAYRLVDVYAALVTGEVRVLRAGEQVPWSIRMLADLGLLTLPPLEIIPGPGADVPPSAQTVWQAILHLLKCRLCYEMVDPGVDGTPLTARFLARWANMDHVTVWRGLNILLARGYLKPLPRTKGRVTLYVVRGHIRHRIAMAVGAGPWARDRWGVRLVGDGKGRKNSRKGSWGRSSEDTRWR